MCTSTIKELYHLPPIDTSEWFYRQPFSFNNPASRYEYQVFMYEKETWLSDRGVCLFPMMYNNIPIVICNNKDKDKIFI